MNVIENRFTYKYIYIHKHVYYVSKSGKKSQKKRLEELSIYFESNSNYQSAKSIEDLEKFLSIYIQPDQNTTVKAKATQVTF